jgi:hypothetical protein
MTSSDHLLDANVIDLQLDFQVVLENFEKNQWIAQTQMPNAFFALPEKQQLVVLDGLLTAIVRASNGLDASSKAISLASSVIDKTFSIKALLQLKHILLPSASLDLSLDFPGSWPTLSDAVKAAILNSMAYLVKQFGITLTQKMLKQEGADHE